MLPGLGWKAKNILIWTPDLIGSICFLVSSYIALIEVSHSLFSIQWRNLEWWVVAINMAGSIAFMLSAFHSYILPQTGKLAWAWGANFDTFIGAVCFFAASYLMIPNFLVPQMA